MNALVEFPVMLDAKGPTPVLINGTRNIVAADMEAVKQILNR